MNETLTIYENDYGDVMSFRTVIKGTVAASGDVTSLLNGEGGDVSLTDYCFSNMFYECTSLTQAPELPATTLAMACYDSMFRCCTSLTQAPELPATTLANYCCYSMFQDCTSLTQAPVLRAKTLVNNCYTSMFSGCTKLNYIKAMFTSTPSSSYTSNWLHNVASSGTFIKNSAATWNVTGTYGIPSGWTVETAAA